MYQQWEKHVGRNRIKKGIAIFPFLRDPLQLDVVILGTSSSHVSRIKINDAIQNSPSYFLFSPRRNEH